MKLMRVLAMLCLLTAGCESSSNVPSKAKFNVLPMGIERCDVEARYGKGELVEKVGEGLLGIEKYRWEGASWGSAWEIELTFNCNELIAKRQKGLQ